MSQTETGYVLGHHQYGKAETHVVRVYRDDPDAPHDLVDYNVSVALSGDFADTHHTGDNAKVLTTDATKNTVYGFAKEHGDAARTPEGFGIALANHFVDTVEHVTSARITIEAFGWRRSHDHPHAFVKAGDYVRTASVRRSADGVSVVSGLQELTVLKTTDSEFHGFFEDRFTSLQPTRDRIMATAVRAQWCHDRDIVADGIDWDASFASVLEAMTGAFARSYSYALQQTVWEMGVAVLDAAPSVLDVRFSCPNVHHFVIDLSPYGIENNHEVHHADDRPYGLIEATVQRSAEVDTTSAYDPGQAW